MRACVYEREREGGHKPVFFLLTQMFVKVFRMLRLFIFVIGDGGDGSGVCVCVFDVLQRTG